MKNTLTWANDQSESKRRKVGAFVVKNGQVLSQGHNGTISGFDNRPEDENGLTYNPHVLHAEENALSKMAKSTSSSDGATMFCTDAPCGECAKRIVSDGIKELYFLRDYHNMGGVDLLLSTDVAVYRVNLEDETIYRLGFFDASYFQVKQQTVFEINRSVLEFFKKPVKDLLSGKTVHKRSQNVSYADCPFDLEVKEKGTDKFVYINSLNYTPDHISTEAQEVYFVSYAGDKVYRLSNLSHIRVTPVIK